MSDRPTDLEFKLKNIVTAVRDVITEWHQLGLQLDLPESDLKLIGSNPDIEGHLRMMLSKWLDYDPEASWDKLANALNTMGKNAIAANIRSKYVRAVNSQTITGDSPASDQDETQARKCTVPQTFGNPFFSMVGMGYMSLDCKYFGDGCQTVILLAIH